MFLIKRQAGAGLIEVLIAVLVLAVGLLGFAAMQTQAMRSNYETLQRTRASLLAEEILDRMRANLNEAAFRDSYVIQMADDKPVIDENLDCEDASNTNVANGTGPACSEDEMADWDLVQWLDRIDSIIPGGDGAITRPGANSRYYKISIRVTETPDLEQDSNTAIGTADTTIVYDFYARI